MRQPHFLIPGRWQPGSGCHGIAGGEGRGAVVPPRSQILRRWKIALGGEERVVADTQHLPNVSEPGKEVGVVVSAVIDRTFVPQLLVCWLRIGDDLRGE